jgi:predicted acetyltransferase
MSEVDVRSAKKREASLIAPLLQDYMAEFAEFESVEQDEDGNYLYPYFDHYWEDPNRYPFLFRIGDVPAGFALLRFDVDPMNGTELMDMAEFYVVPRFRREGVGRDAATRLWDLFPGRWSVRVLRSNKNAYPFWKETIRVYTSSNYNEQPPDGFIGGMYTFTFDSATDADIPDDLEPDMLDY